MISPAPEMISPAPEMISPKPEMISPVPDHPGSNDLRFLIENKNISD